MKPWEKSWGQIEETAKPWEKGYEVEDVAVAEKPETNMAGDLAASWGVGSNQILKGVGSLYGLATGDMDNAATRQAQSGIDYWTERKSEGLVGKEQARSAAVGAADGELSKFGTAVWETVKDPALLASFVTEQAPLTIATGGVGRGAALGAQALGAGAKAATTVGVGGAIGAGGALQGADVGDRVYRDLLSMPEQVWGANDEYLTLSSEIGSEKAKDQIALKYSRGAAAASGALSVASQAVPGGATIEKLLGKGKGSIAGGLLTRTAKGFAGEGAQEVIEEGGGQFIGNLSKYGVDPTQSLSEGVGESSGLALVGGGMLGAAGGALSGSQPDVADKPAPAVKQDYQGQLDNLKNLFEEARTLGDTEMAKAYLDRAREIKTEYDAWRKDNDPNFYGDVDPLKKAEDDFSSSANVDDMIQAANGIMAYNKPLPDMEVASGELQPTMAQTKPVVTDFTQAGFDPAQSFYDREAPANLPVGIIPTPPDITIPEKTRLGTEDTEASKALRWAATQAQQPDPSQEMRTAAIDKAMRAIESRQGVATQNEADLLEQYGMGKPYDRIEGGSTFTEKSPAGPRPKGEPATSWTGGQPEGYKTEKGAQIAMVNRQRQQPELSWKVEQQPNGNFAVNGYTNEPTLPDTPVVAGNEPNGADLIYSKTGQPFSTAKQAELTRNRADLKGKALDVVPVDGGFALQPSTSQANVSPENQQVPRETVALDAVGTVPDQANIPTAQLPAGNEPADAAPDVAIRGQKIDEDWTEFSPESGTIGVDRADMPQIKAEHRGALANFLKARDITGEEKTIPAADLKPTQREFSEAKVEKAKKFEGGDRAILVSSDNHVLDGHHQWVAKRDKGEAVRVIQLDAPIQTLLAEVKEFPSVQESTESAPPADLPSVEPVTAPSSQARPAPIQADAEVKDVGPNPERSDKAKARIAARKKPNADRDSVIEFIAKMGGISKGYIQDITGDTKNTDIPFVGKLFTDDGTSPDDMASLLAQNGYITEPEMEDGGGVNRLYDLINRERNGEKVYAIGSKAEELQRLEAEASALETRKAQAEAEREANYAQLAAEYGQEYADRAREYDDWVDQQTDDYENEIGYYEDQISKQEDTLSEAASYEQVRQGGNEADGNQAQDSGDQKGDGFQLGQETEAERQAREAAEAKAKSEADKQARKADKTAQAEKDAKETKQAVAASVDRFELGGDVDQQLSGQDGLFSKGDKHRKSHTIESLKAAMQEAFPGVYASLERAGLARVITSDQLPPGVKPADSISDAGRVLAYVYGNTVTFVADNIAQDHNVKGLMLHEIGVHLKQLGKSDREFQSILNRMELARKSGNKDVVAAFDRVPKNTPAHLIAEEACGYLLEGSKDSTFSKQILAWFKNKLKEWIRAVAKGRDLLILTRWANEISTDELIQLATAAVRSTASNARDVRDLMSSTQPITETANFRNWFKDSVVTENGKAGGKPLVVYHGSGREFSEFRPGLSREGMSSKNDVYKGFYFARDKGLAERYANGGNIVEAYLRIENPMPYEVENGGNKRGVGGYNKDALFPGGFTGSSDEIDTAISAGYDGIIRGDEIIAFNPNQIKSVNNTGTFDPSNPDIRYSRARPDSLEDVANRVLATPERKTIIGKIRQAIDDHREDWALLAKQGIFDQFASIAELEKTAMGQLLDASESAYKAAAFTKNTNTVLETAMHFGAVEYVNGSIQIKPNSKGLMEILEPLADANLMREWEVWAGAVRAKRLLKEGKEKNYSAQDVAFVLSNVTGDKLKTFEKVHKEWIDFNKSSLDFMEAAGLINQEQRKVWEKDDYVPFHRVSEVDETGGKHNGKGGLSGQSSGIKQLTGGVEKISIVESMVRNTAHMIDASMKNVAMQRTLKLAEQQGVVESLKDARITEQEAKDRLDAMGIEYDADTLPKWREMLTGYDFRQGTVSVKIGGKSKRYVVNDPVLLRSMTSLGPTGVEGIMKILRIPKRLLTTMITSDPSFAARNFIRDTLSTWVTVHEGRRNPLTGAIKGVISSYKDSDTQRAMMAQGVGGGGFYDTSPEGARAHLDKLAGKGKTITTVGELWQAYRRILGTTENANRIAVYEAALKRGASKAEAAYQAMDVLNFSRHGEFKAMRMLIELVPFLGSRLNGLERLYRGAKEGTTAGHQFNKSFMIKGAMITAATLALLASNWDNDDYWDLEEWERDTYYHLFVDGEHYRLPKPFEVGAIFSTIPERMFEQFREDANTKLLGKRILHMFLDTFALDPTPQFVKPALEVSQNKSSFTDRDIVSAGMKFAAPEAQYSPYTSRTFIELADMMPDFAPEWMRSPVRLEHLFRGYLGAMGGYVLMGSDYAVREATGTPDRPAARVQDLPVAGSFIRDGVGTNKQVGRVYDMAQAVNQTYSAIKKYREEGLTEKAKELQLSKMDKLKARSSLNRAVRQMGEISSKMKRIYDNPVMTPEVKRIKLDELTDQRNELAKRIAERYYELF